MGLNMGRRWLLGGHDVWAYNRTFAKTEELAHAGARAVRALPELVSSLEAPRTVWLMLPAGEVTDAHLLELNRLLSPDDLIVDGGNAYYKDDIRRAALLAAKKIRYMDVGVSGGLWGLKNGYSTMVGGEADDFNRLEPLFKTLAPPDGYLHCGPIGAGHFVKMIHNGIEYGMMQAYAEGFEILEASPYKVDHQKVAHLWNQGSVVRSWLLELLEDAFRLDHRLEKLTGYVEDSGEGRWTVQQAIDTGVATPVIASALFQRFLSRQKEAFGFRLLAALRNEFGGHAVRAPNLAAPSAGAGAGTLKPATPDKNAKPR